MTFFFDRTIFFNTYFKGLNHYKQYNAIYIYIYICIRLEYFKVLHAILYYSLPIFIVYIVLGFLYEQTRSYEHSFVMAGMYIHVIQIHTVGM